jgi:hypothetical protein
VTRQRREPESGERRAAHSLYAWEDGEVAPRDRSLVPFGQMQTLVDHVWAGEGLLYPPRIRRLPAQAKRTAARASRTAIEAPAELPSWVLLHEIAHALTSTAEGDNDGHGPRFAAMYVHLLARYARMEEGALRASLRAAGIACDPAPRPTFLD